MKKLTIMGCALLAALFITSCKTQESAYKKAYEKAQQTQQTETTTVTPVVQTQTPVEVTPVNQGTDPATVSVRTESVTLVSGAGLKAYNVVCGSFSVKANAEGLQKVLQTAGYPAQIALNPVNNFFRVVATTHDDKEGAVRSRDALRAKYPDAWLLLNK